MTSSPAPAKRRRADAFANVNRIVEAAKDVFGARRRGHAHRRGDPSGVGNATLYRHFPNRQALAAAVYEDIFSTEVQPVFTALVENDAPANRSSTSSSGSPT